MTASNWRWATLSFASCTRLAIHPRAFVCSSAIYDVHHHARHEAKSHQEGKHAAELSQKEVFLRTSFRDRDLSAASQAGLVNNLNDGMALGLFRSSTRQRDFR
jgi:hypothetical protein